MDPNKMNPLKFPELKEALEERALGLSTAGLMAMLVEHLKAAMLLHLSGGTTVCRSKHMIASDKDDHDHDQENQQDEEDTILSQLDLRYNVSSVGKGGRQADALTDLNL